MSGHVAAGQKSPENQTLAGAAAGAPAGNVAMVRAPGVGGAAGAAGALGLPGPMPCLRGGARQLRRCGALRGAMVTGWGLSPFCYSPGWRWGVPGCWGWVMPSGYNRRRVGVAAAGRCRVGARVGAYGVSTFYIHVPDWGVA